MEDINQKLQQIEQKVTRLLDKYHAVVAEKEALSQQLANCRQEMEAKEVELAELEKKVHTLQIAQGATGDVSDEKTALKQKINTYIREIDKCIAMLNT